jgi:hypothetical protein
VHPSAMEISNTGFISDGFSGWVGSSESHITSRSRYSVIDRHCTQRVLRVYSIDRLSILTMKLAQEIEESTIDFQLWYEIEGIR